MASPVAQWLKNLTAGNSLVDPVGKNPPCHADDASWIPGWGTNATCCRAAKPSGGNYCVCLPQPESPCATARDHTRLGEDAASHNT